MTARIVAVVVAVLIGVVAGGLVDRLIEWSLRGRDDLDDGEHGQIVSHLAMWSLAFSWVKAQRRTAMIVLTAVLYGVTVWALGASLAAVATFFYIAVGLALTYTDFTYYLLPDRIVLPAIAGTIVLEVAAHPAIWSSILLGAAGGFVLFLLLAIVGRGALGGGDVKLMAYVGAATGLVGMVQSVALGAVVAALVVLILWRAKLVGFRQHSYIPYGPYFIWAAFALTIISNLPRPLAL